MKCLVDLSNGSEKTFAFKLKPDAGDSAALVISQKFSFEENVSRIFLDKHQATWLRDFLDEHVN